MFAARTLDPSTNEKFRLKLDSYQAATGIDDVKKDEIWNKTMKNSKISIFCSGFELEGTFQSFIQNPKIQMKKSWQDME